MAEPTTITAMDRCDRCKAPAVARTRHETGDLLWCRHHLTKHEAALTPNLVTLLAQSDDEPQAVNA
jgi:hypothetical protein